jgi:hypothetical protein
MKVATRNGLLAAVALAAMSTAAVATPVIDSAVLNLRLYNDFPNSTLTTSNLYPTSITMQDENLVTPGWANRHNFRLSDNGGIGAAVFMNEDGFEFSSDVTISGDLGVEGGLNVSPWYSQNFDGVFMLRTDDGEISCWGGRLPYYNFTADQGLTYTAGQTVRLGVVYEPNGLTETDPGTIQYFYTDAGGTTYNSPVLSFDQGNPNEPEYGFYGILHGAQVGGWFMPKGNDQTTNMARIEFGNMTFVPEPASLMLLGVALLVLRRR